LLISGIATVCLLVLLRYGTFTAKNLSLTAVANLAFAGCLILVLA
jgi:hypothetical protein